MLSKLIRLITGKQDKHDLLSAHVAASRLEVAILRDEIGELRFLIETPSCAPKRKTKAVKPKVISYIKTSNGSRKKWQRKIPSTKS
jgi:hypothetical protein